ncbi:hypothetical protein [Bradyrhizobium centrosematis]|uniref:hypothetical protein n=1 Tax=Bradyrhizobium centrosematis TaxID=1300039 RepID=UPI00388EE886
MSPAELLPSDPNPSDATSTEVQFALVIARILETVKGDPEYMRQVVYDLARHKLQEQFTHTDAADVRRMQAALEAAINGVEQFSRQDPGAPSLPPPQLTKAPDFGGAPGPESAPAPRAREIVLYEEGTHVRPRFEWVKKRRVTVLLALAAAGLLLFERDHLVSLISRSGKPIEQALQEGGPSATITIPIPSAPPTAAPTTAPTVATKPARALPNEYGVYALDEEDRPTVKLQLLPGKAPDIRIAFSPTFKVPDQPALPSGHVKFVVFRREAVNSIPEAAEVRVVAKISREFSTAAAGKKLNDDDDVWVIRNFSYAFQVSPVAGSPEMYELRSEDPALDLPAGNYVLVLKAQTYFFRIGGEIVDPRQCMERVVASNGTFYAPCRPARGAGR